jgi:hypothetical protein
MRLTKGQLKRIIREEYTRLKRRGLIRESVACPNPEACEAIVADNDFFLMDPKVHDALRRSQSSSHFAAMCRFDEDWRDSLMDVDQDCKYHNLCPYALIKWVAATKAGADMSKWYGGDTWNWTNSIMDEM